MNDWVERFLSDGCAFVPFNCEGVGDQLTVMLANGEKVSLNLTVRTFLKRCVRYFGNDLTALRQVYGQVIGKRYQIPLPLSIQFTLVPFKVRKPVGVQGAYGWFVAEKIQGLKRQSRVRTVIHLVGNHRVNGQQSLESCEQQLRHVLLVKNHYTTLHKPQAVVREAGSVLPYSFR